MEITIPVCVSKEDMAQFARLSGDYNPLHTDESFARGKGVAGRVVYGGLLVAYVSRAVGMHLPGRDCIIASLDMQFRNPLFIGEEATLTAQVKSKHDAVRLLDIAIKITAASRTIAAGVAQVLMRK
jgi:acyl dehydratase